MIAIIANPKARRFSFKKLIQIKNMLGASSKKVDIYYTNKSLDGFRIAKRVGLLYDIVCSYGGDGTLNEVVNGIVDTQAKLCVLPCGTSDVFALELGISRDAFEAAKSLLTPKYADVHVGMVNNRYFILMAGVGIDAAAVLDVNHRLKEYSGKISYILSGIKSAMTFDKLISVQTPFGTKDCYSLIASNVKKYGGNFSIFKKASCFEKNLYICLFYSRKNLLGTVKSVLGLLLNIDSKLYECFIANETYVKSSSVPIQVDGDFAGYSPSIIKATEKCIKVII